MTDALAEWSPDDRHLLAVLFHRMVDDFLDHAAASGRPLGPIEAMTPHRNPRRSGV
jgi:hypothetical protein